MNNSKELIFDSVTIRLKDMASGIAEWHACKGKIVKAAGGERRSFRHTNGYLEIPLCNPYAAYP